MLVHFTEEFQVASPGLNFCDNKVFVFFWVFSIGVKIQLFNWSMTKKWWQGPRIVVWNQKKTDRLIRGEV